MLRSAPIRRKTSIARVSDRQRERLAAKPRAPRVQLRKVSRKQARINRERAKMTVELIQPGVTLCAVRSPVCVMYAHHLHHIKKSGQGGSERRENLLPSCDPCNVFIEDNGEWARCRGLVILSWQSEVED